MDKTRRVLLKLSGEALAGPRKTGFDEETVKKVASQVKASVDQGVQADQIGMLATIMNCIYVSEIFRTAGMKTEIFTPFVCGAMTKLFSKDEANEAFRQGKVVFFAGGTGHPYFSTDTGIILLAKAIDGVYDSDPAVNPDARKYDTISIQEVVDKRLAVIDLTASIMCLENHMPLAVFGLNEENSITNAMNGTITGTIVTA